MSETTWASITEETSPDDESSFVLTRDGGSFNTTTGGSSTAVPSAKLWAAEPSKIYRLHSMLGKLIRFMDRKRHCARGKSTYLGRSVAR